MSGFAYVPPAFDSSRSVAGWCVAPAPKPAPAPQLVCKGCGAPLRLFPGTCTYCQRAAE